VGYGLTVALSRVLFACHKSGVAALSLVGGWLLVIVIDVALVSAARPSWVVPALGLGNTVGLTAAGVALIVAVRRVRGAAAVRGAARAALAGLAGAGAGAAAGAGVSAGLPVGGFVPNVGVGALACVIATAVYAVVVLALDRADLRSATAHVLRRGAAQAGTPS
jgi:putative peptidoglycan lipid II flippase